MLEHPLVEDTNRNGVDDAFERARGGGELSARPLPVAERTRLARQWQRETGPPPVLVVRRPLPDSN